MARLQKFFSSASRFPEVVSALASFRDGPDLVMRFLNPGHGTYPYTAGLAGSGAQVVCQDWHDLTTLWAVFCGGEYRVDPGCQTICDLGANFRPFALGVFARSTSTDRGGGTSSSDLPTIACQPRRLGIPAEG